MYCLRGVDGGAEADMTVSGLQQRVLQLELSFFFGRQIQPELYPQLFPQGTIVRKLDERSIIRPTVSKYSCSFFQYILAGSNSTAVPS